MCKQFCSKSYFPIRRKVSFLTGDTELKLRGVERFGIQSRGKNVSEGHYIKYIFLVCTVVLPSSSVAPFSFVLHTNHEDNFDSSQTFEV